MLPPLIFSYISLAPIIQPFFLFFLLVSKFDEWKRTVHVRTIEHSDCDTLFSSLSSSLVFGERWLMCNNFLTTWPFVSKLSNPQRNSWSWRRIKSALNSSFRMVAIPPFCGGRNLCLCSQRCSICVVWTTFLKILDCVITWCWNYSLNLEASRPGDTKKVKVSNKQKE